MKTFIKKWWAFAIAFLAVGCVIYFNNSFKPIGDIRTEEDLDVFIQAQLDGLEVCTITEVCTAIQSRLKWGLDYKDLGYPPDEFE